MLHLFMEAYMIKKALRPCIIIFLLSLVIELLGFNNEYFLSFTETPINASYTVSDGLVANSDVSYTVKDKSNAHIELSEINSNTDYILLDIVYVDKDGVISPLEIDITATDEGHDLPYNIGTVYVHSSFEKTRYHRLHFYGNALTIDLSLNAAENSTLEIRNIALHANVPLFFSIPRVLLIFVVITSIWTFINIASFPKSKLGEHPHKQLLFIACILFVNILMYWQLVNLDTGYQEPNRDWIPYSQYKYLAEALVKGEVSIEFWHSDEQLEQLAQLSNPYDRDFRVTKTGIQTDVAYYNNNFYVYFGIVPVLLFYLPYYLLTGTHIYNWFVVFISAILLLCGSFYFMSAVIRRWYKDTPFFLYIITSLVLGNGTGVIMLLMVPRLYSIPIITALFFTFWGLGFWVSAANKYEQCRKKQGHLQLTFGSLCMALVAGCRPQFLVGSFFIFPIFWRQLTVKRKLFCKENIEKLLLGIIPYIAIATGIMYYNYLRFDSPFDFGANYNLTTNDMTRRSMNLGRLADGIFMYLFQLPILSIKFPYIVSTEFSPLYLGQSIFESMYGGVFFTHAFTCFNSMLLRVRHQLKEKGLHFLTILSLIFGITIVIVDTQMAGILARYYSDFL